MVIDSSWFYANVTDAQNGGGAFIDAADYVSIYASTFSGNDAFYGGGGADIRFNEEVVIVNSTFSGNRAEDGDGGGMLAIGNEEFVTASSTIYDNFAEIGGGGINLASGSMDVVNTIVAGNSADTGEDIGGGIGASFDVSFSLVQNSADTAGATLNNLGGNIFGVSALLAPLDDTLGPTPVHVPDPDSPAIDAGDPAFVPPPDFDQTGVTLRVLGARVDMGSIEQAGLNRIIPTLSRVGMVLMGLMLAAAGFLGFRRKRRPT